MADGKRLISAPASEESSTTGSAFEGSKHEDSFNSEDSESHSSGHGSEESLGLQVKEKIAKGSASRGLHGINLFAYHKTFLTSPCKFEFLIINPRL